MGKRWERDGRNGHHLPLSESLRKSRCRAWLKITHSEGGGVPIPRKPCGVPQDSLFIGRRGVIDKIGSPGRCGDAPWFGSNSVACCPCAPGQALCASVYLFVDWSSRYPSLVVIVGVSEKVCIKLVWSVIHNSEVQSFVGGVVEATTVALVWILRLHIADTVPGTSTASSAPHVESGTY